MKGSQSCIHKTIVKWYMAQTRQVPDHLMSSPPGEVDSDDCDSPNEASESDSDCKNISQETQRAGRQLKTKWQKK